MKGSKLKISNRSFNPFIFRAIFWQSFSDKSDLTYVGRFKFEFQSLFEAFF